MSYCRCGGFLGSGGIDGYAGRWCNCASPVVDNSSYITTNAVIVNKDYVEETMSLKLAIKTLVKALKEDDSYRIAWKANIAMAFKDEYSRHKLKEGHSKYVNSKNVHDIANKASENFLDILCRDLGDKDENTIG